MEEYWNLWEVGCDIVLMGNAIENRSLIEEQLD